MKILLRICNSIYHSSKLLQTWDTLLNEWICNNTRRPWQKIDVSQSVSLVNTLTTLERKKKVTTSQSNQGQHISEFRLFLFWENVFVFFVLHEGSNSEQIFLFSSCFTRGEQFVFCLFCWDVCTSFLTAAPLHLDKKENYGQHDRK